jgi:hypothetical protein
MADTTRFVKTEKGATEISKRRNNLKGRLRTMLILIDPSKTADELRLQASQIGVPEYFLESLVHDGFIAVVGGAAAPAAAVPAAAEVGAGAATGITADELSQFRAAKSFMNETIVDALGIRAFTFTLKLERASTRADLAQLVPDYAKAMQKVKDAAETRLIVDRLRELLA